MLNDMEIRKAVLEDRIGIDPFDSERVQPVSYDLTLSGDIRIPKPGVKIIDIGPGMRGPHDSIGLYGDPRRVPVWHTEEESIGSGRTLRPHEFILGCTEEYVKLPSDMAARVEGKSSLGRLGLAVHITAGFIDPGFEGQITLEIANLAPWDIVLHPGMAIAQIVFEPVNPPQRDYSQTGHYQGQRGPTESRYHF